jgi:hypothetical protein
MHTQRTILLPLACAAAVISSLSPATLSAQGRPGPHSPLLLTATNGTPNYLAAIDTQTGEVNYLPTGGNGGVSGNAGGVAVMGTIAAVVNFGSSTVSIFVRQGDTMQPMGMITTASKPVSVAFGNGHLVVLGQTSLESFALTPMGVAKSHDGMVSLIINDGSAGQVVTFDGGAMFSETSGAVGMAMFGIPGLVGPSVPVQLPPAPNNNTPLGMVGRGANVYITIAHSDLEALVVNGKIISTAVGPTPFTDSSGNLTHAPCWNTLSGQFLYASDSPGKQLLRFLVSDANIFYDKGNVAALNGAPTDLDVTGSLLGVIDGGDGTNSDATLFSIDPEGELTQLFLRKIASPVNGAAFIQ